MELRRLKIFLRFAELQNVRATAESLHMSSSNVSEQLSLVERETTGRLFERHGRRLLLTPDGHRFAVHARAIVDRMDEAMVDLDDRQDEPRGIVRVGAFPSAISSIVLPAIEALGRSAAGVEVEVIELPSEQAGSALRQTAVDAALISDFADAPLPPLPDLSIDLLALDPMTLIVGRSHPLADQESVAVAGLAEQRWAFDTAESYLGDVALRACRKAGFEPRIVARVSSYQVLVEHVVARGTVAFLPTLAVRDARVVSVRTRPRLPDRRICLATTPAGRRRPSVLAVGQALRMAAADLGR